MPSGGISVTLVYQEEARTNLYCQRDCFHLAWIQHGGIGMNDLKILWALNLYKRQSGNIDSGKPWLRKQRAVREPDRKGL
jgi:hypothetical protein